MNVRQLITRATLIGLMATLPVAAFAAGTSHDSKSGDSASDSSATHYTDKQIKEFVAAQKNVQDTLKKWDSKINDAKNADEKKKIMHKEDKALVKAVKSSGLDPKTYNAIAQKAQNDPDLTKRIQSDMSPQ